MIPIIIINWNGLDDTIECVESVLNLVGVEFFIELVDNGSNNNEAKQLKIKYGSNESIRVHSLKKNQGFTGANNYIWNKFYLDRVDVKHIALLNNDTIVDKYWLFELLNNAIEQESHIVSSKMIQYYNRHKMDNAGHFMLNTGEILPIGYGKDIQLYEAEFNNFGGCGGAVLYNCDMLRKIGFFDDFFTTGFEDAELGLRAVCCGYKCRYTPRAKVWHKGGASIKKVFNIEYSAYINTSILYSFIKNCPNTYLILNLPIALVRNTIIVMCGLIFLRLKFSLIIWKSMYRVFKLKSNIIAHRKVLSSSRLSNFQSDPECFLQHDIKRFYEIFFLRRTSALDEY